MIKKLGNKTVKKCFVVSILFCNNSPFVCCCFLSRIAFVRILKKYACENACLKKYAKIILLAIPTINSNTGFLGALSHPTAVLCVRRSLCVLRKC